MTRTPLALAIAALCLACHATHAQQAPASKDELFGLDEDQPAQKDPARKDGARKAGAAPGDGSGAPPAPAKAQSAPRRAAFSGWLQGEVAHSTADPEHLSKAAARLYLEASGRLTDSVKWKASARVDHEGKYAFTDFYDGLPREARTQLQLRENYLDIERGDWAFRLGRQHIVWGEMVGLFFADVVSAKDMREFVLPEFERIRLPQWAARAEYYGADVHGEFVWVVTPTVNELGKPVTDDFYPYPVSPPLPRVFNDPEKPGHRLRDGNLGLRFNGQVSGWDWSAFAYRSTDTEPTFYRDVVGAAPTLVYRPRFDRITQGGGTLSKDLGFGVMKGELVYTRGRSFEVVDLTTPGGVARQNTVDWALGLDMNVGRDLMVNAQVFQRVFLDRAETLAYDRNESGASLLLRYPFTPTLRGEVLAIASLNRNDWMLRPSLTVTLAKQWRAVVGVDVFKGPPEGFFGRYDANDRVYGEVRYTF